MNARTAVKINPMSQQDRCFAAMTETVLILDLHTRKYSIIRESEPKIITRFYYDLIIGSLEFYRSCGSKEETILEGVFVRRLVTTSKDKMTKTIRDFEFLNRGA